MRFCVKQVESGHANAINRMNDEELEAFNREGLRNLVRRGGMRQSKLLPGRQLASSAASDARAQACISACRIAMSYRRHSRSK